MCTFCQCIEPSRCVITLKGQKIAPYVLECRLPDTIDGYPLHAQTNQVTCNCTFLLSASYSKTRLSIQTPTSIIKFTCRGHSDDPVHCYSSRNNREFGFETQKFSCMNDAAVSQPAISCELEGDRNPGGGEIDKI